MKFNYEFSSERVGINIDGVMLKADQLTLEQARSVLPKLIDHLSEGDLDILREAVAYLAYLSIHPA